MGKILLFPFAFSSGILSAVPCVKGMVGPGGRLIWFVRPRPLRPTTSISHCLEGHR